MTTQNLYYYYDEFCLVYSQGKIHDAETYLLIDYRHVISYVIFWRRHVIMT